MNTQLRYRGLPFQMNACQIVETDRVAVFRGRKTKVESPVKQPAALSADIQFRGRTVSGNSSKESNYFHISKLMPAWLESMNGNLSLINI